MYNRILPLMSFKTMLLTRLASWYEYKVSTLTFGILNNIFFNLKEIYDCISDSRCLPSSWSGHQTYTIYTLIKGALVLPIFPLWRMLIATFIFWNDLLWLSQLQGSCWRIWCEDCYKACTWQLLLCAPRPISPLAYHAWFTHFPQHIQFKLKCLALEGCCNKKSIINPIQVLIHSSTLLSALLAWHTFKVPRDKLWKILEPLRVNIVPFQISWMGTSSLGIDDVSLLHNLFFVSTHNFSVGFKSDKIPSHSLI